MTASSHNPQAGPYILELYGDPVSHSLSPVLHTAALQAAGLVGSYRAVRVDRTGLEKRFHELRRGRVDGANVTMPHKRNAAEFVDELAPGAARAGSVNTVVAAGSKLIGHSTDIDGVLAVWDEAHLPREAPVLILGAGGAAAAALIALEDRRVYLAARQEDRAEGLVRRLGAVAQAVPWGRPIQGAVIVNATPVGMAGETLPTGILEEASGLLDMPYGHGSTAAVRRARRTGLPHATGTDLLIAQAAVSFTLWTGRTAPLTRMRTALQMAQATE